jgi:ubiquinol-cytochrome c reductase cytochrome b subunit/menaquinol-cytochrome c reductase cytochrome b/c subunit
VAEDRIAQRERVFEQYKRDVKERGKPFYPYAMFHDTVMSFVVVVVIIGLAVIWKWTTPGDHTGFGPTGSTDHPDQAGWLGKLYDEPADPGTISFVPRPDWYFYFLFYLLRIFKWPESVILGTVGLPTIALLLLIALPFIDLRAERRPLRRPVAMVGAILTVITMGVLTYRGATAKESLGVENLTHVAEWAQKERFAGNAEALRGAKLFAVVGCLNCHTYLGTGSHNLGAPDLSDEGSKNKGVAFQIAHLKCPACVNPGSPMPRFDSQGAKNLQALAVFLEASKGGK